MTSYRKKKTNWKQLQNFLPSVDVKEYSSAVPGCLNEAFLLESLTSHPSVWNANDITGQKHEIIVVFDSIYGGKSCSVGAIKTSKLKECNRNEISVDLGNGKIVKRKRAELATDKAKSNISEIVDAAVKKGTANVMAGESICYNGKRSKYLLPLGTDYTMAIPFDKNDDTHTEKFAEVSTYYYYDIYKCISCTTT